MASRYIRTYTEFNRISIKQNQSKYLRAWYLLREQKGAESGWIPREKAELALQSFYEKRGLTDLLKTGEGVWWRTDSNILHVTGIEKLIQYLEVKPGDRVLIPVEAFQSLQLFKAIIYSTYFTRKAKSICRTTISSLFGISKRSQIRYAELAQIYTQKQFAHCKETLEALFQIPIAERLASKEKRGVWREDIDEDGEPEIVWQIGNLYASTIPIFDKKVNHRYSLDGGPEISDGAEPAKKQRMYYFDVKKVTRIYNAGEVPKEGIYNLEKTNKTLGRIYGYIPPLD